MGQLTIALLFIELFPKIYAKFRPKSQSTTKHQMFRATNLRQSRKFYTKGVGDVGDIKKVCPGHPAFSLENHFMKIYVL